MTLTQASHFTAFLTPHKGFEKAENSQDSTPMEQQHIVPYFRQGISQAAKGG